MMKLVFLLMSISLGFAAVDEEALLLRKANNVLMQAHMKNLTLIGVNPKTCKQTTDSSLIVSQMSLIKTTGLSHCPEKTQAALKPFQEELELLRQGILPASKTSLVAPMLIGQEESSEKVPEEMVPTEVSYSTVSANPGDTHDAPAVKVDEEKKRMLEAVKSDSEQLDPREDDSLFKILTKAYFRNLKRIFPE